MLRRSLVVAALLVSALSGAPSAQAAVSCNPVNLYPRKAAQLVQPTTRIKSSTVTFVFRTNCGAIRIVGDAKAAPITVRNLADMAKSKFFNNTYCHRLSTAQIFILQCGDPTGTGTGGPGYSYVNENLPTKITKNRYPAGTVAMANAGADTNGSQFFIVYKDGTYDLPANYTIWGHVTGGLNIIRAIAAKGATAGADGWPAQAIAVLSVTVSEGTP